MLDTLRSLATKTMSLFKSSPQVQPQPAGVVTMAANQVVEGGTFAFEVVARNKFGTRVAISDAAVALSDSTLGAVTVQSDGTNGVFTAQTGVQGTELLTPSAAGVTGAPFSLPVVPDATVATVAVETVALTDVAHVSLAPAATQPA